MSIFSMVKNVLNNRRLQLFYHNLVVDHTSSLRMRSFAHSYFNMLQGKGHRL